MIIETRDAKSRKKHLGILNNTKRRIETDDGLNTCPFEGLWRSVRGCIYVSNGEEFTCISVHSELYKGWIGKLTIKEINCVGGKWYGLQAFRNRHTGVLSEWISIELQISETKIIKYFPKNLPPSTLTNGYIEHYYRINIQ